MLLAQKGAWQELKDVCQSWLRAEPASAEARLLWAVNLARQGRLTEAQEAFRRHHRGIARSRRDPDRRRLRRRQGRRRR